MSSPRTSRLRALGRGRRRLLSSTALGTPIGAVIGGLGDRRWTMEFVAALWSFCRLQALLFSRRDAPLPPKVTLARRLEPLDGWARRSLPLPTTLIALSGIFTVYTYSPWSLIALSEAMRPFWVSSCSPGVGGTVSNLFGGRVVDAVGSRKAITTILILLAIFSAALPWVRFAIVDRGAGHPDLGSLQLGPAGAASISPCCLGPIDRADIDGAEFEHAPTSACRSAVSSAHSEFAPLALTLSA